MTLSSHFLLKHSLPTALENKPLITTGIIASIPSIKPHLKSFIYQTNSINHHKFSLKTKLSWYKTKQTLNPGDQWQLNIKLKKPHGFSNPGGFDYEKWLFQNGIRATGYVINNSNNQRINSAWYHQPINRLRRRLMNKLNQAPIHKLKQFEYLVAITTGYRSLITTDEWNTLRRTGTNHLFAIAGLHIGLIATLFYFLTSFCWRRIPFLMLYIPAQIASSIASIIGAIIYSLMAGFPIQTQRALIMLIILMSSIILRRKINSWNGYSFALFLVLLIDPLCVLSMSFWLSFITVAIIIYCMTGRINRQGFWWHWGRIQWVITLGLIPLSLWFFQESSLTSLAANLIAVPWFSFIIVPLCFTGIILLLLKLSLGNVVLHLALINLHWLWRYLVYLSQLPIPLFHYSIPNIGLLISTLFGVILLLSPKGLSLRPLSLFFLLPLLFWKFPTPKNNEIWFTLFDVGQGLASIIQTKHHVLIYDTGPSFSPTFDAGSAVIIPYLQHFNIQTIDKLVVSHGDNDHIGGAKSIIKNCHVKEILTSIPKHFKNKKASHCYQGQHWRWDGVKFSFLSPKKGYDNGKNNNSCVLQIKTKNQSILLTGDIEHAIENDLVNTKKINLRSTILIAPHHGSITSSSIPFIQAVHPQYVLFSTGYLNRFHFPNKEVIKRYVNLGSKYLSIPKTGSILFKLNGEKLKPECYRIMNKHIWNQ